MKRFQTETKLMHEGYDAVIGCDEVGRGCLAGPVVAAAVSFDKPMRAPRWWKSVTDSKLLQPKVREEISTEILAYAAGWGIGVVENDTIDEINIHHASLLAMNRAVTALIAKTKYTNSYVLVDGKFMIPNLHTIQQAIVKGDLRVHSIAAASIVAKVYRDNLMRRLNERYPCYGLDIHKGYATVKHRNAIKEHGLSAVHRLSFCGNIV